MRDGKGVSRSKHDEGVRNGFKEQDKGLTAAGKRTRSSSDSDDADVMRQLLSTEGRQRVAASARGRLARTRDIPSNGLPSDSDNAMSEDDVPLNGSRPLRRGRKGGSMSPVPTSPGQMLVPNSSSSGNRSRDSDKMDVDDVGNGRSLKHRRLREAEKRPTEAQQNTAPQNSVRPVEYVACHTWPPCAVCAGITKTSLKHVPNITMQFRKRIAETMPPATDIPPPLTGPPRGPRQLIMPPPPPPPPVPANLPRSALPVLTLRPGYNPPRHPGDFFVPNITPAAMPRANPSRTTSYPSQPDYPMEPLFVSAMHGLPRQQTFKILPPGSDGRRTLQNNIMNSIASGSRPGGFYNRSMRNAQASSSSVRVEDLDGGMDGGEGEEDVDAGGGEGDDGEGEEYGEADSLEVVGMKRGRGKGRNPGRKQRAKRYNRKKNEEWPPKGWDPIWEEERPRMWGNYLIPDDVPSDRVYDHLKKFFDLKSAGFCHWRACKPQNPEHPDYKMLKRHVETVHLGLKLVCEKCGVRKRADNRRKATHKRGCPERENDPATTSNAPTPGKGKATTGAGGSQNADEDELMEDEGRSGSGELSAEEGSVDEDEEIDQLEDDNSEEDQLDGADQNQRMESEYESEDD